MGKFDQSEFYQSEPYTSTNSVTPRRKARAVRAYLALLLLLCFGAQSLAAQTAQQTRLVVRDKLGLTNLLNLCKLLGCSTLTWV